MRELPIETPAISVGLGRLSAGRRSEAERFVKGAYAMGIRAFDTARSYGGGCSEDLLATALPDASDIRVTVKVGQRARDVGLVMRVRRNVSTGMLASLRGTRDDQALSQVLRGTATYGELVQSETELYGDLDRALVPFRPREIIESVLLHELPPERLGRTAWVDFQRRCAAEGATVGYGGKLERLGPVDRVACDSSFTVLQYSLLDALRFDSQLREAPSGIQHRVYSVFGPAGALAKEVERRTELKFGEDEVYRGLVYWARVLGASRIIVATGSLKHLERLLTFMTGPIDDELVARVKRGVQLVLDSNESV